MHNIFEVTTCMLSSNPINMGVGKGCNAPLPRIFTQSFLNLLNFKNSSILVVNTGSIFISPPEKFFCQQPLLIYMICPFFCFSRNVIKFLWKNLVVLAETSTSWVMNFSIPVQLL